MKITYFIGSTIGGGAEHVICDLASYMCRQEGFQSEILTVTKTDDSYFIDPDVNVVSLEKRRKIKNKYIRLIVKIFNLYRYIKYSKTDLYVVFLPETIKAIMLFKKLVKVPILVSERSNPASYDDKLKKQMVKAFSMADAIVFQTEEVREFYLKRIANMPQNTVIPNAIAGKLPEVYVGKKEKILVAAGRFKKEKNFELLIRAFANVSKEFTEYKLYLYGEGDLKNDYIKLSKQLGIEDKVVFPGYVENLAVKIRNATAFVLSSDFEGMPNALMEAMAMGIPCISTDCEGGGASYLIKNMENGILVCRRDVNALTKGITTLLRDVKLQKEISTNAVKIRERLSKEIIYARWKMFVSSIKKSNEI